MPNNPDGADKTLVLSSRLLLPLISTVSSSDSTKAKAKFQMRLS